MEKNYYDILDKFMVRTPLKPFNNYEEIWNEDYLRENVMDESFLEAVKIASESMYQGILKGEIKGEVLKAVMKYMGRSKFRTVPFGTFCGVSVGEFKDENSISYDEKRIVKRIRPDYEWLVGLIKKIEIENKGYKKLKLYTNNVIEEDGNKFKNAMHSCFTYADKEKQNKVSYIDRKNNTKFILNFFNKGCYFDDLLKEFWSRGLKVKEEVLEKYIADIIKSENIYTEIRPPFEEIDSLQYIIDKLSEKRLDLDLLSTLQKIDKLIEEYNNLGSLTGLNYINKIEDEMSKIYKCQVYIQVDTVNPFKISLNKDIKNDLSELMKLAVGFSLDRNKKGAINKFVDDFKEKYGEYREVPVSEAYDKIKGVGFGDVLQGENPIIDDRKIIINDFFKEKIEEAVLNNKDFVITEEEVEKYRDKSIKEEDLVDSLELYLSIKARDLNALNNKEYSLMISPKTGSDDAGKTFGRFTDLEDDIRKLVKDINDKKEDMKNDDCILCDFLYMNTDARANNVSICERFNDYQLNLCPVSKNSKVNNIELSDVYIGIDNDELYLKSKKLNKKIKLITGNMLNIDNYYGVARLLREIGEYNKKKSIFSIFTEYIPQEMVYIPRIKYKNVIICSRRWKVNKELLGKEIPNYNEFKNKLHYLNDKFKMPKILYYRKFDQLMLVNLEEERFIEILYKEFRKESNNYLLFQEADLEYKWLNVNNKYYKNEFVFEFIKNKTFNKRSSIKNLLTVNSDIEKLKSSTILSDDRNFGLFSPWLYLKLYNNPERVSELIGISFRKLIEKLYSEELIDKWFYLRYADKNRHVRLRLNIKNYLVNYQKVLEIVQEWLNTEKKNGLIGQTVLAEYERESERYGGPKLISAAESVFMAHSESVMEFLYLRKNNKITISNEEFAVCFIINFMELLGLEYEKQMMIFDCLVKKDERRKEFVKNRKRYLMIANSNDDFKDLNKMNDGNIIYKLINIGQKYVIEYGMLIEKVDAEGELRNYKVNIVISMIHLFCNRLFDIDREKEREVLAYTRHTLYGLKFFKRRIN